MPKGLAEAVIRKRTKYTMAKMKRTKGQTYYIDVPNTTQKHTD